MWILVIFVYAGYFSKSDSVALTNIPGFSSQQECEAAGKVAEKLTSGTQKDTHFVCLHQGR